jgi:hypothetical protein
VVIVLLVSCTALEMAPVWPIYDGHGSLGTFQESALGFCNIHKDDPRYPGCIVQAPADPSVAQAPPSDLPTVAVGGDHQQWMTVAGVALFEQPDANYIVTHESGWQVTIYNRQGSGAYGLCQALPGIKMSILGPYPSGPGPPNPGWLTDPIAQLRWCNWYAHDRYHSWAAAKAFWIRTDCRPACGHWW